MSEQSFGELPAWRAPAWPAHLPREVRTRLEARRTLVMGVLNVTPDSFSDGGRWDTTDLALERAEYLRDEGADLIDVGGESTRPGSTRLDPQKEWARIEGVVGALVDEGHAVSVDTVNAETARAALAAGAHIINDVSGGQWDRQMPAVMAESDAICIIQHWRGFPGSPEERILTGAGASVVETIGEELAAQVRHVCEAGVARERIVADPGLGFAKDADASWAVLRALPTLDAKWELPILIGASRKRMIAAACGSDASPERRDAVTAGVSALCSAAGVWAVRVHEPFENRAAITAARAWLHGTMDGE